MKSVLRAIDMQVHVFSKHKFFELLQGRGTAEELGLILTDLGFFVMVFQDLLRVNAARIEDPQLRALAEQQRKEDAGHERWLLKDLARLGHPLSVEAMFAERHKAIRDVAYGIVSESLKADHDATRMAIPMAMEASGGVSLRRIAKYFSDCGQRHHFFSTTHVEVEEGHEILTPPQMALLDSLDCTPEALSKARASVLRIFQLKTQMLDQLGQLILTARSHSGPGPLTADVRQYLDSTATYADGETQ